MFQKKRFAANQHTLEDALPKLEHFCAYQERSPQEVREKINNLGLRGDAADRLYALLETEGFFQEERYAFGFVRGKFRNNKWGRNRIQQALRLKGIGDEMVAQALETIDPEEYAQTLQKLWEKKSREYEGDAQGKSKAMASLIRAGFEPSLVFSLKVVN